MSSSSKVIQKLIITNLDLYKWKILMLYSFSVFTAVIRTSISQKHGGASSVFIGAIILLACIPVFTGFNKNNRDLLFNSLPISKTSIVISKYFTTIIIGIIGLIISLIVHSIKIYFSDSLVWNINEELAFKTFAIPFTSILILTSLSLPVFFKFKKINIWLVSFLISIFLTEVFAIRFWGIKSETFTIHLTEKEVVPFIILLLSTIALFLISLYISIHFYKKKDL
ncbi:hypothetical protein GTQ40_15425 [Flavobacteriaceae bacterium R38]|nr:hypothetical protein [Flavobacteriaceae bacterium R38]